MSRGFVREGDQEEPIVIPPRAILPDGTINYVTPTGKKMLLEELESLEKEVAELRNENEDDLRRDKTMLHGKIKLLQERIASARVINGEDQPDDEVRFAAVVTYQQGSSKPQTLQIVGVDEADVTKKKIAFTTPIARALTGAKIDETVTFKLGSEERLLKITNIRY